MNQQPYVLLDESDTVVTLLSDGERGDELAVDDMTVELSEPVPFGHKVAIAAHERGDAVRKYGEVIASATESIEPGAWVHTHNAESRRGKATVDETEGPTQ